MPVAGIGKAVMIGSVLLVLIVELLNSAVEAAIDRISLDHHKLSKRAKDIGSAAVLIALLNVLVCWILVLA
jgi:diacylglycerol kinase (ATP)